MKKVKKDVIKAMKNDVKKKRATSSSSSGHHQMKKLKNKLSENLDSLAGSSKSFHEKRQVSLILHVLKPTYSEFPKRGQVLSFMKCSWFAYNSSTISCVNLIL